MTKSNRIIWLLVLLVVIIATSTLFGTLEGLTMPTGMPNMTNAQNNLATAQNTAQNNLATAQNTSQNNLATTQNTAQNNLATKQNTAQNNLASIQNKLASMTSGTVESFLGPRARIAARNTMFY